MTTTTNSTTFSATVGPPHEVAPISMDTADDLGGELTASSMEVFDVDVDAFRRTDVARLLGIKLSQAYLLSEQVRMEQPEDFKEAGVDHADSLTFNRRAFHSLTSRLPAPEDWLSVPDVARLTGFPVEEVTTLTTRLLRDHPIRVRPHLLAEDGAIQNHIDPEFVSKVSEQLRRQADRRKLKERMQSLEQDFSNFAEEMTEGESLEAEEFKKLIGLFGAEAATDLLFHYRPDFMRVPVEYVKSFLADYLGEFLVVRGQLDFEHLEMSQEFLSNNTLKQALTDVIKRDCLANYHRTKRSNPAEDDFDIIAVYLDSLRDHITHLNNEDLNSVVVEVENYYLSLFDNFNIPDNFVGGLKSDRPFPDLNQRINIKEISEKKRMLIADEFGLGKSASAIIAKERLGVGLAVIVAPKSVIEKRVWQNYLSDALSADGEQIGYFKPGQAPRVLVVDGPASLEGVGPNDYDYIIISQESLKQTYTEALQAIGFDMLIVDEAHKLKNIQEGLRANQLIQLADYLGKRDNTYTTILTATPAPNKVSDIAMTLRLLYPDKFADVSNLELARLMINGDIRDLRSLLLPRMQMKTLAECIDMPPLDEVIEYVELSDAEKQAYEVRLDDDEVTFSTKIQDCRRFVLNPATLELSPPIPSSKALKVGTELRKTFVNKQKVVLFVNDYVDQVITGESTIMDFFHLPDDVQVRFIHGSVDNNQRYAVQQEFQYDDSKILLVVNGQTSDVGVDFSAADEMYIYNEGWTLAEKRQEIGRAYRPGRTTPLTVRTFIAAGTVEVGIHEYIKNKDKAIRKLFFGIPLSELEREMLLKNEQDTSDTGLEVNPQLAKYYFSAMQRIHKIFGNVKQQGEKKFKSNMAVHGREYAATYRDLTRRSYQANMARLTGTLIDTFVADGNLPTNPVIVDLGSGPEMLKRHISARLSDKVISLDINSHHFDPATSKKAILGSVVKVPLRSGHADAVSLGLVLDSSKYLPSKRKTDPEALERLEILKEINRVLRPGGHAIITQIYSLDLADPTGFKKLVERMGFEMVKAYSGQVYAGSDTRGRIITLVKRRDCPDDMDALVTQIREENLKGLRFADPKIRPKDPKRIDRHYRIGGKRSSRSDAAVVPLFNTENQRVVDEEEEILTSMQAARLVYKGIRNIPTTALIQQGMSRMKNNGKFVLFKALSSGGSVVTKD